MILALLKGTFLLPQTCYLMTMHHHSHHHQVVIFSSFFHLLAITFLSSFPSPSIALFSKVFFQLFFCVKSYMVHHKDLIYKNWNCTNSWWCWLPLKGYLLRASNLVEKWLSSSGPAIISFTRKSKKKLLKKSVLERSSKTQFWWWSMAFFVAVQARSSRKVF